MWKKILVIAGLCLLAGYLVFAAFFFEQKPKEKTCSHFEIVVNNKADEKFIESEELEKMIDAKGLNPYGKQMKDINTLAIQEVIISNKLIKSAEVFVTSDGGVRAEVVERIPVLRVIPIGGESYYIDKEGEKMPLSKYNTAYLPIASGNIKEELAKTDLYKFALFLCNNEFWNAQIEQIAVQSNGDIVLIPRVGDQQIIMGNLNNFEDKLQRLQAFYANALPETGWNRYVQLNLKYDKQVVGVKR